MKGTRIIIILLSFLIAWQVQGKKPRMEDSRHIIMMVDTLHYDEFYKKAKTWKIGRTKKADRIILDKNAPIYFNKDSKIKYFAYCFWSSDLWKKKKEDWVEQQLEYLWKKDVDIEVMVTLTPHEWLLKNGYEPETDTTIIVTPKK